MAEDFKNLSISIKPYKGRRYKSISEIQWDEIPPFAMLTGKNGSGKTQLLEILAYRLSGALPPGISFENRLPVEVVLKGTSFQPEDIAFIPSSGRFSGGRAVSIANLPNIKNELIQKANKQNAADYDIDNMIKHHKALKLFGGKAAHTLNASDLKNLSDDYEFMIDDVDVTSGLTCVFVAHRFKMLEQIEREQRGFIGPSRPLSPTPWDVLNESLAVGGFPYQVISPCETPILDPYELRLRDIKSRAEIKAIDLSSGEKVLLQLVLWLYSSGKVGVFPKLLLLDEPDAHLHPSMTVQFLDVLSEVLVKRHGVRIIMTTHSPSTVALAPLSAVFQLERGETEIKAVESRQSIISILTAGLVTVSASTKFCFVEDEQDVNFYDALREVLMDYGPSKDPAALATSPTLAFIAVSVGAGVAKVSGGSSNVQKWIDKLDADPLRQTFVGIIDRDIANQPFERIKVIGRYSFENYLLDPLNIYCLLLENGSQPTINGITITSGDEHLLRMLPETSLQAIADCMTGVMEKAEPAIKVPGKKIVEYTIGKKINVPSWVIDHRGHNLLPIAQKAFGGSGLVSPPRLIRAFRRARLIPAELASLLANIQAM